MVVNIKNISNNFFDNNVRLIDVFITGPLQIFISFFLKITFFKYFMLITGILNIIYNGYVFLLKNKFIKKIHSPFKHLITKNGKTQLHRLYNLFIMYPIFIYILLHFKLPSYLQALFYMNIVVGFAFNLYYFVSFL